MDNSYLKHLEEIGTFFKLNGRVTNYSQINDGNINKTFKVTYDNNKSYIFQQVNVNVFIDPIGVMRNIDNVTTSIRENFPDEIALHYHHTIYGDNYLIYKGQFWRIMKCIDSITFNTCDSLEDIKLVGEAFGSFQRKIANFDSSLLTETIKNFHNTKLRLEKLLEDAKDVQMPELDYIRSIKDKASKISIMASHNELPIRTCHNDTKANNVLFDKESHKPLVVIDLDTLMPGTALNDFADGARFICSTAAEDEQDLNKISFSKTKFEVFATGFLSKVKDIWTKEELDNLVLATFSITIELAARFLNDYILGNVYFKINYPEHNLVRTRAQLKLAKSIEDQWDELQHIINDKINN